MGSLMACSAFLLRLLCARCRATFFICRCCYRGHKYCSDECREPARQEQKRQANRRHRHSEEGRLDNRDRVRAHRARKRALMADVMDQTPPDLPSHTSIDSDGQAATSGVAAAVVTLVAAAQSVYEEKAHVQTLVPPYRCAICGLEAEFIITPEWVRDAVRRRGRPP